VVAAADSNGKLEIGNPIYATDIGCDCNRLSHCHNKLFLITNPDTFRHK
jgi:hypothetical protein